jgi:membrane protease YdiL (CAAX protease family)
MQAFFKKNLDLAITILLPTLIMFGFIISNQFLKIETNLGLILIQQAILISPVIFWLSIKKVSLLELGFKKFKISKAILQIFASFIIFFLVSGLITYFTQTAGISIPGYGQQESYLPVFEGINFINVLIIAAIIAPIVEELLFRGLIYKQITGSENLKILFSGIFFALIHFQIEVIFPLIFLGLILGYLRKSQDSIWVPIIFHMLNNSIAIYGQYYLQGV